MGLTENVKQELITVGAGKTSVRTAELATVLRFAGGLHTISGRIAVEAELDSQELATRVRKDLAEIYGVRSEGRLSPNSGGKNAPTYLVRVLDGETLARQTGLLDARRRPIRGLPNKLTTGNLEDLSAIWRGAFLAAGSLTDPGRSAALEIVCPTNEAAMALVGAANRLQFAAKAREVRGVHRVVIREDEAISAVLTIMGATETVKNWEDLRHRCAQAAVAACARVERALELLGDDIPEHLKYAGELRLNFRDASLDELGHHADPPMTKDAVAGRIRRLLAMADKRAQDLGVPGTESAVPDDIDA